MRCCRTGPQCAVHRAVHPGRRALAAGMQALGEWVPGYVELGPLYKLYMVALTVFATNAINGRLWTAGQERCTRACMQPAHRRVGLQAGDPSSLLARWQEKGLNAQLHKGVDGPAPGGEQAAPSCSPAQPLPTCRPAHSRLQCWPQSWWPT